MSDDLDLRELATKHGKTQAQLGVCQPYASLLMRGATKPGPKAISTIAENLGVDAPTVYAACQESRKRAAQRAASIATANAAPQGT